MMGLAALKISDRCAHSFPTCAPVAWVAHTRLFSPRGEIAGSDLDIGGRRSRQGGLAEDGPCVAPADHGRAAGLRTASGGPMGAAVR